MTQKARMIRIALELDESLLKELSAYLEEKNQIQAPSKLSRSDFIRVAIQTHLQKEKQQIEQMKELAKVWKRMKT